MLAQDPDTLWVGLEEANKSIEGRTAVVGHLRSLNSYFLQHRFDNANVVLGEDDEKRGYRWEFISRLVRSSLMKGIDTSQDDRKRNAKTNKNRKAGDEDLVEECLHLVIALCIFLEDEVDVMADEDDSDSFIQTLSRIIQKGFDSDKNKEEDQSGHHSPRLHGEALRSFAWLVFYCGVQAQMIDFLRSCEKYFVFNKEIAEDIDSKNSEVMIAALQCWVFFLASLDDERIHDLFSPEYLSFPPRYCNLS